MKYASISFHDDGAKFQERSEGISVFNDFDKKPIVFEGETMGKNRGSILKERIKERRSKVVLYER